MAHTGPRPLGLRREQTLALQIEVPDDFLSRLDGNIADEYLFDVPAIFHQDCHRGIVIFGLCRRQLAGNLFLGVIPSSNGNPVLPFRDGVEAVSAAGIRLYFDAAALPFALFCFPREGCAFMTREAPKGDETRAIRATAVLILGIGPSPVCSGRCAASRR